MAWRVRRFWGVGPSCILCLALDRSLVLALAVQNLQHAEQQNQGISHTHSEPSATFNMNHMLLVTLDSNKIELER
jgi:hypothetical protein